MGRKDEELCLHEKFHASGECLTGIEQKRTVLAMGTSLWGSESMAGFLKRIGAEVRTKFRTKFRLFSTVIIPVTNVRTEQAQIQWKVFKFGWVWNKSLMRFINVKWTDGAENETSREIRQRLLCAGVENRKLQSVGYRVRMRDEGLPR